MTNFYNIVLEILKQDERFFAEDGTLLRNTVYEAAMKMDKDLIKALFANEVVKERLFTDIDGIAVFDKVEFGWVVNNREFLPDSYTRYKNKIGLVDNKGQYITNSNDVELVFPYKDCILEGGQTKDDQKRDEIFYNETLAPDEVDRLLYPKVFTNAKRYTVDGEEETLEFSDTDNLIIKGNNLLTINSLLKRYENKVKCVYIDVPYNTGNDSFGYNDRFNHSSWLCFIKNRLEIAKKLLSTEGTIAISVDNYELAYILVLLDEIFGKENRKNIITVRRASVSGAKVINPGVVNIVEYVVIYAKDTASWNPNRVFASKEYDTRYGTFIENVDEEFSKWTFKTVLEAFADYKGVKKSQLKKTLGENYQAELEKFVISNANSVVRLAALDDKQISNETLQLKRESLDKKDKIIHQEREGFKDYYLLNGNALLFARDRILNIDGNETFASPLSDIWDDVLPNDLHNEGGVEFKKGKKPEKLIGRIIDLTTNKHDIVLDFFAGSGTTGAVALKKQRQFILCEQMDYIQNVTVERIYNSINGEKRGVSQDVSWQGGGSFVYCELAKLNQNFVAQIEKAKDNDTLSVVWDEMQSTGFISSYVNPKEIDTNEENFTALSFEDKKKLFVKLLDKNQLYVNYCDIDDEDFAVSEKDKAFTRSFYEGV